jgi:hypothetical protein
VTRGRDGVFVDFGSMFGQGNPYIRTARSAILGGAKKKFLRVAVIDIGAFTTDLAILEFNVATLGSSDDGLSALEQESFPMISSTTCFGNGSTQSTETLSTGLLSPKRRN